MLLALILPATAAAQQSLPEVDNAAKRAQDFLVDTKDLVILALHTRVVDVGGVPLPIPMVTTIYRKGDPVELADGAEITIVYHWYVKSEPAGKFDDTVRFHCDRMGRVDGILSAESSDRRDPAFREFGKFLAEKRDDLIKSLIEGMIKQENQEDIRAGKRRGSDELSPGQEWGAEFLAHLAGLVFGVDARKTTEVLLGLGWDFGDASKRGFPTYGMDGFRFGQSSTHDLRTKMRIPAGEVAKAVPAILLDSAKRAKNASHPEAVPSPYYPDEVLPDYSQAAELIAAAVQNCAQITAHQAFLVTSDLGKGTENLAQLGPNFATCIAAQSFRPATGPPNAQSRAIYFSVKPAGRGFRDASGLRLEMGYSGHPSDPPFPAPEVFDHYGIVLAFIPQSDAPCAEPPKAGMPSDRQWKEDGSPVILRVRFDCEFAELYDIKSHLIVGDLQLERKHEKEMYVGSGIFSDCPGGKGKIAMTSWSGDHVELKVQTANQVDHVCGGLKEGHVMDFLTHYLTVKMTLKPYGDSPYPR